MKIAYVRHIFPRLSTTFITEEIAELKSQGHEVRIFAVIREPSEVHAKILEAGLLEETLYYTPSLLEGRELRGQLVMNGVHGAPQRADPGFFTNYFPGQRVLLRFLAAGVRSLGGNPVRLPRAVYHRASRLARRTRHIGNLSLTLNQYLVEQRPFAPDLIHCPFAFPGELFLLAQLLQTHPGVPFTITLRARDLYTTVGDKTYVQARHAMLQLAARIITISRYNRDAIRRLLPDRKNIPVIHSAIDPEFFSPAAGTSGKQPNQIVTVARLVEKKGLEFLIHACGLLRSRHGLAVTCKIVGDGPLREKLQELIAQYGVTDSVHLEGSLGQAAIRDLLAESTVFVLPCVVAADGDRDILPNSLKEAMAMALPVVTSDISGIEELVAADVDGLLIEPGSAGAIADAVARLLSDPDLREHLGRAARKKIERDFNIKREGRRFSEILETAAATPR